MHLNVERLANIYLGKTMPDKASLIYCVFHVKIDFMKPPVCALTATESRVNIWYE